MMKIYVYEEDTKKFISEQAALVDEFGKYILPSNSTFKEPLPEKEGFDVCFDVAAEKWVYIEQPKPHEPTPEEEKQARIYELKQQLNATDYKIIKCSECSLAGDPLPYDIAELHAERQAIRDEINELGG